MARFICLHKDGEPIYSNIDMINTITTDMGKSYVTFTVGYLHADESAEEIMKLIEEKGNGNQH